MKRIPAARFKEQCLAILDRLGPEGVIVTKHGKPVARVLPATSDSSELLGVLRDYIQIDGDLTTTGLHWNAGD
jgi:prevent-host-death family protein